jgi:hypothetical protein
MNPVWGKISKTTPSSRLISEAAGCNFKVSSYWDIPVSEAGPKERNRKISNPVNRINRGFFATLTNGLLDGEIFRRFRILQYIRLILSGLTG